MTPPTSIAASGMVGAAGGIDGFGEGHADRHAERDGRGRRRRR